MSYGNPGGKSVVSTVANVQSVPRSATPIVSVSRPAMAYTAPVSTVVAQRSTEALSSNVLRSASTPTVYGLGRISNNLNGVMARPNSIVTPQSAQRVGSIQKSPNMITGNTVYGGVWGDTNYTGMSKVIPAIDTAATKIGSWVKNAWAGPPDNSNNQRGFITAKRSEVYIPGPNNTTRVNRSVFEKNYGSSKYG